MRNLMLELAQLKLFCDNIKKFKPHFQNLWDGQQIQ